MAKLKTDPITEADFIEFLDTCSDFAFEIAVIKALASREFACEHSGTYLDPATKKPRQFDIRATYSFENHIVRLAVECKNLRKHFPLLISCLPRTDDESFHDVAVSVDPDQFSLLPKSHESPVLFPALKSRAKTVRLRGHESIYKRGHFVGKSSDQIGRDLNNAIVANDSDVYPKWAQAIASTEDLVDRGCYEGERGDKPMYLSFVLPVLVVPDGTLWKTHFDHEGNRNLAPQMVDRIPLFVNKSYFAGDAWRGTQYRISHLEFVTLSGLGEVVAELTGLRELFPHEAILQHITDYLRTGQDSDGAL